MTSQYDLQLKVFLVIDFASAIARKVLAKEKSNSKWNAFIRMKNVILKR